MLPLYLRTLPNTLPQPTGDHTLYSVEARQHSTFTQRCSWLVGLQHPTQGLSLTVLTRDCMQGLASACLGEASFLALSREDLRPSALLLRGPAEALLALRSMT